MKKKKKKKVTLTLQKEASRMKPAKVNKNMVSHNDAPFLVVSQFRNS
jgi:hypothetical protein